MSEGLAIAVVLLPLLAAAGLAVLRRRVPAGWVGVGAGAATLALAVGLAWQPHAGALLRADRLAIHMAILVALLGLVTAWGLRRQSPAHAPALVQAMVGALLLALLAGDGLLAWLAMLAASVIAAALTGVAGDAPALRAAWRLLVPAAAALLLALFGTLLLHLAAPPRSALPDVALVLVLVGYGSLAGLVPLQPGVVAAAAEGPAPVAALLAGGLPGVALVLLLRLRDLAAFGPLLAVLGLLALLLAAVGLWRRPGPRQAVALAAGGQFGVVALAFGLGGTAAGLLHLSVLLLLLPAVLGCLALAGAAPGGMIAGQRPLGLALAAGLAVLAVLPPGGLFASALLIGGETLRAAPWLALPLGVGLVASGWALAALMATLCLGPATPQRGVGLADLVPAWGLLALACAAPLAMAGWFAPLAAGLR